MYKEKKRKDRREEGREELQEVRIGCAKPAIDAGEKVVLPVTLTGWGRGKFTKLTLTPLICFSNGTQTAWTT
jgi:hypothetical protein